jgi:broad specificity phosphatase PhoE
MADVRERFAFACDIGRHRDELALAFPNYRFDHLPDQWWPERHETADETIARANEFRRVMRGRDDANTTLLVSHWAFILSLTGVSVANGELLEYDPSVAAPQTILWRP